MKKALVLAVALIFVLSATALAGVNADAKIAVHVRAHSAKAGCSVTITYCGDIVTAEAGFSVDAFIVWYDLVEYLGTEYGMCWPPWTYSAAFTSCSDLVIGSISWPGDGASHTWTSCKVGVAVSGYVWLYADYPGMICPCPHPASGAMQVLDCGEGLDDPMCVHCAGVYGMVGDDPCWPTGTEQSTWGGIKAVFE